MASEVRLSASAPAPSVEELHRSWAIRTFSIATGAWQAGKLEHPRQRPAASSAGCRKRKAQVRSAALLGHVAVVGGRQHRDGRCPAWPSACGAASCHNRLPQHAPLEMPADAQELELAMQDGVDFVELAAPVAQENGVLTCREDAASASRMPPARRSPPFRPARRSSCRATS